MDYFECDVPPGDGHCSDNSCPCSETRIPRGTGYLYIEQDLVDFRRDYVTLEAARKAMERRLEQEHGSIGGGRTARFYRLGPILVCEQGAKLRNLDRDVAAADAKHWWETGQVPLRTTPMADISQKGSGPATRVQKEATDGNDRTLCKASQEGNLDKVKQLLQQGADVNEKTDDGHGFPALSLAAAKGHSDVVAFLLEHGADPNLKSDLSKATPLLMAVNGRRREAIQILLSNGASAAEVIAHPMFAFAPPAIQEAVLSNPPSPPRSKGTRRSGRAR